MQRRSSAYSMAILSAKERRPEEEVRKLHARKKTYAFHILPRHYRARFARW